MQENEELPRGKAVAGQASVGAASAAARPNTLDVRIIPCGEHFRGVEGARQEQGGLGGDAAARGEISATVGWAKDRSVGQVRRLQLPLRGNHHLFYRS